jgi:cytochrome b561/polyisoprenoid-binding protein YceI
VAIEWSKHPAPLIGTENQVMTPTQYSTTAKILHWLIALALAFQLSLGWRLEDLDKGAAQFWGFQLHKSVGITILLLTLARVAIRFWHPRPALPADSKWAQRLAKFVHGALYAVMLGGPLTGWAIVSTGKIKFPTLIFGVIPWPHLPLPNALHEPLEEMHELLAFVGALLILLHVAGALRHQFGQGENLLGRMVPGLSGVSISKSKAAIGAGLAIAAFIGAMALAKMMPAPVAPEVAPAAAAQPGFAPAIAPPAKLDADGDEPAEAEEIKPEEVGTKEKETSAAEQPIPLTNWQVAKGGKLGFTSNWSGTPINGSFGRWDADIKFSPAMLAQSAVKVSVDLASVNTADSQRDEMLQSDTFFNTAAHPKAVFTATSFTHKGGDKYTAAGTLNLHGQSRPVALNFSLKIDGGTARVSGSTSFNRTSFGVGTGDYAATDQIADPVRVSFSFTAKANSV